MLQKIFSIFFNKKKKKIEKEIEMLLLYKLESNSELNELQLEYLYLLLKEFDAPIFDALHGFAKFKKNHTILIKKLAELNKEIK
ncbi:hypothetical protein AAK894_02350 [Lachnospiraceae bacterium 46-61]